MRRILIAVIVVPFIFSVYCPANENRTWSDSTGRFKVEAAFVRMDGEKVVIKKADGKFQTIPLDKLSKDDQNYVNGLNEENPFAGGTDDPNDNPFAGGNSQDKPSSGRQKTDIESRKREIERRMKENRSSSSKNSMDRSSSRRGSDPDFAGFNMPQCDAFDCDPKPVDSGNAVEGGGSADTSWNCDADAVEQSRLEEKPRNLSFSTGELPFGVWAKEAGLALFLQNGKPKALYATAIDMERKAGESKTILFLGDPLSGKTERMQSDQKVKLLGVSPDGSKALFREEAWGSNDRGKRNFVHVIKIGETKLEKHACYYPFAEDSQPGKSLNWDIDVEWGDWIDEDHIMLISHKKRLVVLNVDTGKVVWKISDTGTDKAVFSAGKKYCLLPRHNGTILLETVSGKAIGKLDRSDSMLFRFAFSPDGKTIAALGNNCLQLWNATTGEMDEPFYIGESFGKLLWANNRFLLVGGRLVDIRSKSLVWSYSAFNDSSQILDGYCWLLTGSGSDAKQLSAVIIPHGKALIASQAPESKRFCVRPGMEVALMIDNSIQNGRNEIIQRMQNVLKENELVLKNNAPIIVHLKVRPEEEATIQYVTGSRFDPPSPIFQGGGTEIKYRPYKFSIEFQKDGKTLWSTSKTTASPNNIPLDELQSDSLQNVVNKAMAKANADYKGWFTTVKIPKRIPNSEGCGYSTIGISGIQDQTEEPKIRPFPGQRRL